MNRLDYAQNCVLARVYAKGMLDRARIDRMINAADAQEAFRLLLETEYSKSSENVKNVHNYDNLLGNKIQRIYRLGEELLLDEENLALAFGSKRRVRKRVDDRSEERV